MGAAQKLADYENENTTLQAKLRQEQRKNGETATQAAPEQRPQLGRFGSLMRKPSPSQANGIAQPPNAREKELEEKFVKEQTARIAAEKKTKEVNAEIEDLSTTLFQQANEMVATERKEKAALTEKIRVLESKHQEQAAAVKEQAAVVKEQAKEHAIESRSTEKLEAENAKLKTKIETLEKRSIERMRRLERLEAANKRIERVKTMLKPG